MDLLHQQDGQYLTHLEITIGPLEHLVLAQQAEQSHSQQTQQSLMMMQLEMEM
jgi:hypothetical protein